MSKKDQRLREARGLIERLDRRVDVLRGRLFESRREVSEKQDEIDSLHAELAKAEENFGSATNAMRADYERLRKNARTEHAVAAETETALRLQVKDLQERMEKRSAQVVDLQNTCSGTR